MPALSMKTWANQERVRTDDFNNQIRDAINLAMDPPQTVVYRTTSTNFPNGQVYIVNTWEATSIDNANGWATGTPTRVMVNTPGKYVIDAKYDFGNWTATGYRAMHVRKNSAGSASLGTLIDGDVVQPIAGTSTPIKFTILVAGLVIGDYFEMFIYQNSGASVATSYGLNAGYLSVRWIGF